MNDSNKNPEDSQRGTDESPSTSREPSVKASDPLQSSSNLTINIPSYTNTQATNTETNAMKRASAKKLIERYFYQLIDGCGNPQCGNQYCASSGEVKNLTPNQAAAQAIQLFSEEARLCEVHPSKVARTQNSPCTSHDRSGICEGNSENSDINSKSDKMGGTRGMKQLPDGAGAITDKAPPFLTERRLIEVLDICKQEDCYLPLIRIIGKIFSDSEALARSFLKEYPCSPIEALLDRAPEDLSNLKKEDFRILEGDLDKDVDSCALTRDDTRSDSLTNDDQSTTNKEPQELDMPQVRRALEKLFEIPNDIFETALVNALKTLSQGLEIDLRVYKLRGTMDDVVRVIMIMFEIPVLGSGDYLETALPAMCNAVAHLPIEAQAVLVRAWANQCKGQLRTILQSLQQLVTLKVINGNFNRDFCVQDDNTIVSATKVMKMVYYANIVAGEIDSPELRTEEPCTIIDDNDLGFRASKIVKPAKVDDALETALEVCALDSRKPLLKFEEFYNEPLSDVIEMDKDFAYYKSIGDYKSGGKFSFMNYSFILTPATKTLGLYFDNRIRMLSERRMCMLQTVSGFVTNPYLRIKVRRDHIIDDALVELEMAAMESPKNLKKQLVVEFEGEQGVDEGGVSKEFFQLVVEEVFNPDYGMFRHLCTDDGALWFNPSPFESDAQYTLIGIVIGLAIYNNVILSVGFPMVVYRKLMGIRGSFPDLEDWDPSLYQGLKDMLDYTGDDMEDVFMQTFQICHRDVFGNALLHDLKENGDQIQVNQQNKREFVDLYADFLLNRSVEKQFSAFRRGFQTVTDESPLRLLFRPEEVELLVCGSKVFNFNELEEATEYEGGYTSESKVIRDFWSVVHAFDNDSKRKLLQFTTGSDRVPIGGLSKLKLIIAKNGSDSDRLPTSHTCFNVLLLPEYSTREKLADRLVKAISYSKGFGML